MACSRDPRVAGLIALGLPITVEGRGSTRSPQMTEGQLARIRQGYLRKLFDPRSWARLLTLQTDGGSHARVPEAGPDRHGGAGGDACRRRPGRPGTRPGADEQPQPVFRAGVLRRRHRGMRMLLLFSETDRLWWEFEEKFLTRASWRCSTATAPASSVSVVPKPTTSSRSSRGSAKPSAAWRRGWKRDFPVPPGSRRRAPARIIDRAVAPRHGGRVPGGAAPPDRILVTDGGTRAALAVTRALGRRGHRVIVGDQRRPSLSHASRHCAVALQYPDPVRDEQGFLDAIVAAAEAHQVDVVLPITDITTALVTRARDRFAACHRPVPPTPT